MKLYDFAPAPNPRRVRIFLAEKGIEVPTEQVDLRARAQHEPAFVARNPSATVPVLELDDGTCISESVAICRYFEALQPEPPLMGEGAREQALVEMWQRRMEIDGMMAAGEAFRNATPGFKDRALAGTAPVAQIAELAGASAPSGSSASSTRCCRTATTSPETISPSRTSPRWWRSTSPAGRSSPRDPS
jgi:glutathione S-transferase